MGKRASSSVVFTKRGEKKDLSRGKLGLSISVLPVGGVKEACFLVHEKGDEVRGKDGRSAKKIGESWPYCRPEGEGGGKLAS